MIYRRVGLPFVAKRKLDACATASASAIRVHVTRARPRHDRRVAAFVHPWYDWTVPLSRGAPPGEQTSTSDNEDIDDLDDPPRRMDTSVALQHGRDVLIHLSPRLWLHLARCG